MQLLPVACTVFLIVFAIIQLTWDRRKCYP